MATTSVTPRTAPDPAAAASGGQAPAPVGQDKGTAAARGARWSVSRTLAGAFAVLLVFLAVLGAVGLVGISQIRSGNNNLNDRILPGRRANIDALQSLTNAQTGIRGYCSATMNGSWRRIAPLWPACRRNSRR